MKKNWYLEPWFTVALLVFISLLSRWWMGFIVVGLVIAGIFIGVRYFIDRKAAKELEALRVAQARKDELETYLAQTGYYNYEDMASKIVALKEEHEALIASTKAEYEALAQSAKTIVMMPRMMKGKG